MLHTYATEGTGRYPVCGAPNATRGEAVTQYKSLADLCPACRTWWAEKSARITQQQRKRKRQGDAA